MTSTLLWSLIAVQMAMGAFDTFYHHELNERLAWRPSQRRELRLHGVRNLAYAMLFAVLGWAEVHGMLAMAMLALLAAELIITLMDFVEEDRSRKLPATERVTHTLLALNYGAILVLGAPVLIGWAGQPAGVAKAWHGGWSVLCAVAAVGVVICGVRDLAAAARSVRLARKPAGALVMALPRRQTILVTGATGFIGRRLVEGLVAEEHEVIVLTRNAERAVGLGAPLTVVTDLEQIAPDKRIDAIVNLAGEPIADGLWTPAKRARIVASRLAVTSAVLRLIARLERRPAVLVNGSAIGWYGLRGDEALSEDDGAVACFSHEVCAKWEAEAAKASAFGVRVATLRIGLVLGTEGGMLARLLLPFEFGLGGRIGSGTQWMSWIVRDDLVRLIAHVIAAPGLEGPINATAPAPVRNADFAKALGRALHRPALLPLPAWPLRIAGGDFAKELLLGGQRVLPDKALASGFAFAHPALDGALAAMLGGKPEARRAPRVEAAHRLRLS
ncbi:MAG TPA: TIGR01777 family oxidoreductase [Rhizomicrobium sp.]|jgi:hypothetical protein|nr:TIGR01777 family oxidoreductase [Rhizomicrobium sp.]